MIWGAVAAVLIIVAVYGLVIRPLNKIHKQELAKKDTEIAALKAQVSLGKKTEEIKDEANKEKDALNGPGGFDASIRLLHDQAKTGAGPGTS